MGLFQFLHRNDDFAISTPVATEWLKLNGNMPIEVFSTDNPFMALMSGRINMDGDGEICIQRIPTEFDFVVLAKETKVVLHVYDTELNPVVYDGVVYRSTTDECVIMDCSMRRYKNHRRSKRLPVGLPASVYNVADGPLNNPQSCKFLDISPDGACILSTLTYNPGDVLTLKVNVRGLSSDLEIDGTVVRVISHDGFNYEYGLSFKRDGRVEAAMEVIKKNIERRLRPDV